MIGTDDRPTAAVRAAGLLARNRRLLEDALREAIELGSSSRRPAYRRLLHQVRELAADLDSEGPTPDAGREVTV